MNLLNLKAREEELVQSLRKMEQEVAETFESIANRLQKIEDHKICLEDDKEYIAQINFNRGSTLAELAQLKDTFNAELKAGKEKLLADIKSGKVGVVDTATGRPLTVALFAQR